MVWKLCVYCFLNEIYVGSFIWCIKNTYKGMDMWATSFLKSNRNSIIFCFPQVGFLWKILQLFTENAKPQVLGYFLTLYQAGFFKLLKGRGEAFWPLSEKLLWKLFNSSKSLETWHNISLDFSKNFNNQVIKLMISVLFLITLLFNNNFFCLTFKFFLCWKSNVPSWKLIT